MRRQENKKSERERDNSFEKKGSRRLGNVKFRLSKLSKHSAWMRLGCLVSPQVIVDFSRAFNFVCALLDFPDRHTAFGAKHLQVSNAPWVWKLKNSTILRAQGIMLQFRTMSNLEFQRCKQNLTPGFWKHLKHLRQKSQWVSERPSERVRVCLRMCAGASEWVIGCLVEWWFEQLIKIILHWLMDWLIYGWLVDRFFCLYICLFINFTYLLIHYSIVIGELCVGCMTELSKSFLLAVERDTKTPWRIQAHETAPKANFCMIWCSASVLQHWVQERVLKTLERS